MTSDLRIACERPSSMPTAWRVVQRTPWPSRVVSSTIWRPCRDLTFHRAVSLSRFPSVEVSHQQRLENRMRAAQRGADGLGSRTADVLAQPSHQLNDLAPVS